MTSGTIITPFSRELAGSKQKEPKAIGPVPVTPGNSVVLELPREGLPPLVGLWASTASWRAT